MTSLELIKQLCDKNGTSLSSLEKVLKYGNGSLAKAKNLPADRIYEIALHFNVRMEDLMPRDNDEDVVRTCPDCGLTYDSSFADDIKEHDKDHKAWKKAADKFGELHCDYVVNEMIKAKNRNIRDNKEFTLTERMNAELRVLRCLFSRSVQTSGFDLRHCSYEKYVAMMLANPTYGLRLDAELLQALKNEYGTLPGINSGTIYHIPASKPTTAAAHKKIDISDLTEAEVEDVADYIAYIKTKRKG